MNDEKRLSSLQNEMRQLGKSELTLTGSLSALFKGLKTRLGDPSLPNGEVVKITQDKISKLKGKKKKAKKQLAGKMEEIEEMSQELEK